MISMNATPKFGLGACVGTPVAMAEMQKAGVFPHQLLDRHVSGDWGEVCKDDAKANDWSVENEARILSAYTLSTGVKVWIITEADRASTCILLPEEY